MQTPPTILRVQEKVHVLKNEAAALEKQKAELISKLNLTRKTACVRQSWRPVFSFHYPGVSMCLNVHRRSLSKNSREATKRNS